MDFEERLAHAQQTSENSQKLCSQYHKQAKSLLAQGHEQGASLRHAESLLQTLQALFLDQLDLSVGLFTEARRGYLTLEHHARFHSQQKAQVDRRLLQIFHKLKACPIDSALPTPMTENASLFHYVDAASVAALQESLEEVIALVEEKRSAAKSAVQELEGRLDDIQEMMKGLLHEKSVLSGLPTTLTDEDELAPSSSASTPAQRFAEYCLHYMQNDLNAITSILVSSSSLADRMTDARARFLRTGKEELLEFQLEALEGQVKQLPHSVAKASECLRRMQDKAQEMTDKCHLYQAPFARCNQIKERMRDLDPCLTHTIQAMNQFTHTTDDNQPALDYYLTQLENLISWYDLYFVGYRELLFEIQRREAESLRQRRLIETMEKELRLMYEEENAKRTYFLEEHGKYLPTNLCPVITEAAVRYHVGGDFQPAALPKLSRTYERDTVERRRDKSQDLPGGSPSSATEMADSPLLT